MSAPYRLSRHDFTHLQVKKRVSGSCVTLALGAVPGREARGFAVVVSKKSARKATDRNLIKRRIRAIFRELHTTLPVGMVIVAYGKPGASRANMAQLRAEVCSLFTRLV